MVKNKPSKEFLEKKEFLELQAKFSVENHERTMEALKFRRESDRLFHERDLERGRIKFAEMRKNQQRKADFEHMKQQSHGKY